MCLTHNSRPNHLTIPIIKTTNSVTMLNIIQIITKTLMRTLNPTNINQRSINPNIKAITKDNTSIQETITINTIINNMRNHMSQEYIREMKITPNSLDKNKRKASQFIQPSQMIFWIKLIQSTKIKILIYLMLKNLKKILSLQFKIERSNLVLDLNVDITFPNWVCKLVFKF